MAGERVLLVDDEVEFVERLKERMEARGMRVRTAHDGNEAVRNAGAYTFDAIIMDIAMPGLDGIETLRLLMEHNADLQVILLTGHATVAKSVEAIKLGAMDVLEKPVKIDDLVGRIHEARTRTDELSIERAGREADAIAKKRGW